MSRRLLSLFVLGTSLHWAMSILAEIPAPSPNDAIRVTVSLNADGSRTVYQFDNAKHEAIATTTESRRKIARQDRLSNRRGGPVCQRRRFWTGRKVPL